MKSPRCGQSRAGLFEVGSGFGVLLDSWCPVGSIWLASMHVLAILATSLALVTARPAACSYQLGFAALHEMIPTVVGDCVSNEVPHAATGDTLQQATGGLLVWRKEDNWTAFTDGSETWVNGPFGLQQRDNSQRFSWEYNPEGLQIVPTPVSADRCHTSELSLSLVSTYTGAGNRFATFRFYQQPRCKLHVLRLPRRTTLRRYIQSVADEGGAWWRLLSQEHSNDDTCRPAPRGDVCHVLGGYPGRQRASDSSLSIRFLNVRRKSFHACARFVRSMTSSAACSGA